MIYDGMIILANAGTALMWATMLHLLVGNFLIGVVEAWILCRWFGASRRRASVLMILANYFSMFVGLALIVRNVAGWFEIDLYNVWRMHLLLYGLAYAITLVLEWPAVYAALPAQSGRLKRSVMAELVVQTASNLVVLLWYSLATTTPQGQGWTLIPPDRLALPQGVVMYYIGEKDGDVYRMVGGERAGEKVAELESKNWIDRLFFAANEGATVAELRTSAGELEGKIQTPVEATTFNPKSKHNQTEDTWWTFGSVPRLGRPEERSSASTAFWADRGLYAPGAGTFAVNVPYVQWEVRNATELPDGRILLQLGENQICLVDPKRKTAGVLVRGRGPAVALEVAAAIMPTTAPVAR